MNTFFLSELLVIQIDIAIFKSEISSRQIWIIQQWSYSRQEGNNDKFNQIICSTSMRTTSATFAAPCCHKWWRAEKIFDPDSVLIANKSRDLLVPIPSDSFLGVISNRCWAVACHNTPCLLQPLKRTGKKSNLNKINK